MSKRLICLMLIISLSPCLNATEINPYTVKNVDFIADYFPSNRNDRYGIIVLNGSAGGKATDISKRISAAGHSVLALAYFDEEGLPDALEMIPLGYFDAPKAWLLNRKETRNDGVIVFGGSKGAELALVLASYDTDYRGVIAVAPSSVVWAGIPKDRSTITSAASSWSREGKAIPFVPYIPREGLKKAGLNKMIDWHSGSLGAARNIEQALIKVEKINGPVLLLSGGKDLSWPADRMSFAICERLNLKKKDGRCKHVSYEDGGHTLGLWNEFKHNEMLEGNIASAMEEITQFLNSIN